MSETHFEPAMTKGWVIRNGRPLGKDGRVHWAWLYGWGISNSFGPLDYSAKVFSTKAEAQKVARRLTGETIVERVTDSISFAIAEAQRRHDEVLAGDREDKHDIAQANLDTIAYLEGRKKSR